MYRGDLIVVQSQYWQRTGVAGRGLSSCGYIFEVVITKYYADKELWCEVLHGTKVERADKVVETLIGKELLERFYAIIWSAA